MLKHNSYFHCALIYEMIVHDQQYQRLSQNLTRVFFFVFQIYLYRVIAFSNTTILPCCPITVSFDLVEDTVKSQIT